MDEFKYLGVNHPKQCTVCKMGEDERAGRLESVETTLSGCLGQKDSSQSEREGFYDGRETCYSVWFARDGRAEDVQIFIKSDKFRNEYIGRTAQVEWFEEKVREASLRWFGHVHRWDSGNAEGWCDRR